MDPGAASKWTSTAIGAQRADRIRTVAWEAAGAGPGVAGRRRCDAPEGRAGYGYGTTRPGGRMSDEYELYGQEATVSREEAARRLRAIADELASNNGLQVTREGKRLSVRVPDEVQLSVEIEQDDEGMEIEIEIGWRGGPIAT